MNDEEIERLLRSTAPEVAPIAKPAMPAPARRARLPWAIGLAAAMLLGVLALILRPPSDPGVTPAQEQEIESWVKKLADADPAARDEAIRKLAAAGDAAVPALEKALTSADVEVRARAKTLLEKIAQEREDRAWRARAATLPETWPGGAYDYLLGGKKVGTIELKTERVRQEGRDALKLTDRFDIEFRGRKVVINSVTICEIDRFLTPIRITQDASEEGAGDPLDVTLSKGKAKGTLRGREAEMDLPEPLVTEFALFRVATIMPLAEGAELKFHSLESSEMNLKRDHVLRCVGREEVAAGGKTHAAWKFEHSGTGIRTQIYWVSDGRVYLKALVDGRKEWVLAEPKPAAAVVKVLVCRQSNHPDLAEARLDRLWKGDAERALADAAEAALRARRKDLAAMADADFDALVKTVRAEVGALAASIREVKRERRLVSQGDRPAVPGNETHAAILHGELARADLTAAAKGKVPTAALAAVERALGDVRQVDAGEPLPPDDRTAAKERFLAMVKARLAGDADRFVKGFAAKGWNLDKQVEIDLPVGEIKAAAKTPIDAPLEDVLGEVEVLDHAQAVERFGKTQRIERVFRRGGMGSDDLFVVATLKRDLAPELFRVGVDHVQGQIFYVMRRAGDGWLAVPLRD